MVRKFCMSKRKNLDGWDQILLNCSGVGSWRPFKVDAPPREILDPQLIIILISTNVVNESLIFYASSVNFIKPQ